MIVFILVVVSIFGFSVYKPFDDYYEKYTIYKEKVEQLKIENKELQQKLKQLKAEKDKLAQKTERLRIKYEMEKSAWNKIYTE